MRRLSITLAFVLISGIAAHAQIGVHDASVTARNRITAALHEYLLGLQREQHSRVRRMTQRLSLLTSLGKYSAPDPPRWRTHGSGRLPLTHAYNDALIHGDPAGAAYLAVSHPVTAAAGLVDRLPAAARRVLTARLATLNLADTTAIVGMDGTGQLRYSGRKGELPAIDALDADVVNPSTEQSATAVLDKISGAVLIGATQRQARLQLLLGIVEQLLVDSKRARDTEAAAMNMQLVAWRERKAANEAFVAGAGDALRTWRQP